MDPFLEIDTSALARNAAAVQTYVGVPVIGVMKSDGYRVKMLLRRNHSRFSGLYMYYHAPVMGRAFHILQTLYRRKRGKT